ncbi:acyl dehydratase [Rhodobacterales bacterium]|nr:acyl dehydratase [Rhodobacterales bacterium]
MTQDTLTKGESITFRKTMSVAEQGFFTGISGNLGGLYVDRRQAQSLGLADMAVFELAAGALFSTALARLAGNGWRISAISFRFSRALVLGETLAATATLETVGDTLAFDLSGAVGDDIVIEGEASMAPVASNV